MRMHSMDSKRLYAILEDKHVQLTSQVGMLGTTCRTRGPMPERDELVVRLYEHKMSKENLERKVSEHDIFIKSMMGTMERIGMNVSSFQETINQLQKANEVVMSSYGGDSTIVRRTIEKWLKAFPLFFLKWLCV